MRRVTFPKVSIAGAALALVLCSFIPLARAASGNMYLNLSSASVQQNNTFTSSIRINPGTSIDTVDVTLTYDPAMVQYQSITYSGSPFTTQLGFSSTANSLHFTSGWLGGSVSSDTFIATVTFKALAGSGSSALSLAGSNAASGGTVTNPALNGTTVSFATPPSVCPTGQIGTPPNCTTPVTTSPNPTPTPKPTKPTPTPLPVESAPKPTPATTDLTPSFANPRVQYTHASLTATTKAASQVYARFGLEKAALNVQTPVSAPGTTHNIAFDSSVLLPGETYYYQVFSKDQKGNVVQSEVKSFTTKGLEVKIAVYDRNHRPLKNATVTLHSTPQTAKTDQNGNVTFTDVSVGNHELVYEAGGKSYTQGLQVANNVQGIGETQTAAPQTFSIVYNLTQASRGWLAPVVYGLLLVVVLFVGYQIVSGRRSRMKYAYDSNLASRITVGGATSTTSSDKDDVLTSKLNNFPVPTAISPGTVVKTQDPVDDIKDGKE